MPRRRSPALRLPGDAAVTSRTSAVAAGGGPGQRVLAVTRARSNHCEDPAAFRVLASVHGVGASVLAVKGAVAPAPRPKINSLANWSASRSPAL